MEEIKHRHVGVKGHNIHVAEIGSGPDVLFLHGFPEIWYSWRHQMIALADAGFHAIAPDFPGYGLSDQPTEISKATYADLVEDMAALIDNLGIKRVFVVGKDFGALVPYHLALLHPDKVKGVVTLGVPYIPPGPRVSRYDTLPEGFYIKRWQEPGRAEADFGRYDTKTVVKNIYILFSRSELPIAEEGKEIMDLYDPSTPLPEWFTEDDLNVYASLYEKSGLQFALEGYRGRQRDLSPATHLADYIVNAPTLLIMGTKDYILKFPGMEAYISSGILKANVPDLEIVYYPEGSHFVQEQFPKEVNQLILDFFNKHL